MGVGAGLPLLALAFLLGGCAPQAEELAAEGSGADLALTFDDLPGVTSPGAPCDTAALADLNRRLLAALRRNDAPAAGLVTGSRMCDDAPASALSAVLRDWLAEGHTLGNHTFSHRDLNEADLGWYLEDIERNERLLEAARRGSDPGGSDPDGLVAGEARVASPEAGAGTRWFRAPMLHYGDTPAKHAGLRAYLDSASYRVARVSIDNQEWVFADVYARAKAAGDSAVMQRVGVSYVSFMDSVLAFFEDRTPEVVGRYPPQVLLLHVNELNADRLDDLIAMIRRRGYRLVTMEEALADPWYAEPDGYVGPRGLAWIHRRVATEGAEDWPEEPREPDWLVALRREYLP